MATIRTKVFLLATSFPIGGAAGNIGADDAEDLIESVFPTEAVLTFSATLAWNLDTAPVARVVLTGNTTITLSNGEVGRDYVLTVVQDATGSRTVAIASTNSVVVLGAALFQTAANARNVISVHLSGTERLVTVI